MSKLANQLIYVSHNKSKQYFENVFLLGMLQILHLSNIKSNSMESPQLTKWSMEKAWTESQVRVVDTGFNIILADFNLDWADQN